MRRYPAIIIAVLILFVGTGPAKALLIFEDTFDNENEGNAAFNYFAFTNWAVSDGAVDLIGNDVFDFLPSNGLYVDMDGSANNAGKISTKEGLLDLDPGDYLLSFELAGNQRNPGNEEVTLEIGGGDIFKENYSLGQYEPFTLYTVSFSIDSAMDLSLSFEGRGEDSIGMLLDDVRLDFLEPRKNPGGSNPVPEPGTLLLLGAGLAGLAAVRKKIY